MKNRHVKHCRRGPSVHLFLVMSILILSTIDPIEAFTQHSSSAVTHPIRSISSVSSATITQWRSSQSIVFRDAKIRRKTCLTTANEDNQESHSISKREKFLKAPIRKAVKKFKTKPGTYLLIPCIAAIVGWFTNWLAVQMIFYPIKYRGLPIIVKPEVPLGLLGWQGIVPCKTRTMSEAMVHMVTSQLLSVQEVFKRLDPKEVANLLAPEVPKLGQSIVEDIIPKQKGGISSFLTSLPTAIFTGLPDQTQAVLAKMNHNFLKDFTIAMQDQIGNLLNVKNCVVNQMLEDRSRLGLLFQKCGQKELDFLTNSGLWFGFLLGLIQMAVALFWDNPWSLSIGGGIVGLATNWLALKWIFEPVNPTKVGPFILQGQFLRRQKEVAKEFSDFFATRILTSEQMFHSIMTDPETAPVFERLFTQHFTKFAAAVSSGLGVLPEPEVLRMAAKRAVEKLPNHIGVLHGYVNDKLQLQETLRISMEGMTSAQFERVLHPIFEEDELTLILAGAALGFAAGLVQQGLETGKIQLKLPNRKEIMNRLKNIPRWLKSFTPNHMRKKFVAMIQSIEEKIRNILRNKKTEI
ncbi:hypothetical protein CTEN210_13783 [Chaetoceros tenuissimus]|uniref:DUF445 domain-containing protein n=1 Tax=Chaetoceros tenuissimus TaxID=426638 RepID=A0AAD3D4F1_9STRA|nr:hypothetical protein CTEN210_13783 [Chaetoceros tenuissimus]